MPEATYFKMRREEERKALEEQKKIEIDNALVGLNEKKNLGIDVLPLINEPTLESETAILFLALLSNSLTKPFIIK